MANKFLSGINVTGTTTLNTVANAGTDTDKFLVLDASGNVDFRTGDELYADLGIGSLPAGFTSTVKHAVKAGVALTKGQAVYVTSADGTNMIVGKASNVSEATSSKTMGLIETSLSINGIGNVITEGLLAGLDTTGATAAGDPVWLGTDGNLIYGLLNKPYAPAHLVFIGVVTRRNANNGEIFVKVQNGFELKEIHDVDLITTTPINGHILGYNGTLWVNKTIAGWLGYTPADDSLVVKLAGTQTITGTKTLSAGAVVPSLGSGNQLSVFINTSNIQSGSGNTNRLGFNNSNDIYFNKGLTSSGTDTNGGVISFNNSASRTYTLPNATGTLALTSDLGAYLPLTGGTLTGFLSSTKSITTGENGQISIIPSTNTSAAFLQVTNNDGTTYFGKNNNSGSYLSSSPNATLVYSTGSSPIMLYTNGNMIMTLTGGTPSVGGNVLINTTSDNGAKLQVSGNATFSSSVEIGQAAIVRGFTGNSGAGMFLNYGSAGAGIGSIFTYNYGTSTYGPTVIDGSYVALYNSGTERMRVTGGALLVGTTTTTGIATGTSVNQGVSIIGGIASQINNNANQYWSKATGYTSGDFTAHFVNGGYVGGISTNGSTTTYAVASDYRLKQDFKDYSGLDLVSAIKTYDYEWKSDNSRMYGVIAHELQEVIPYAVTGEKDAERMQGVDYSKIVPIMVKAIQEQQAQIEELSNKIVALESK